MIGNEYYFRVKAVNDEGESAPLEAQELVVPKKKIGMLFKGPLCLTYAFISTS
jgi:hypothetical protein